MFQMAYAIGGLELEATQTMKILSGIEDPEVEECLEKMAEATENIEGNEFQKLNHMIGKMFYLSISNNPENVEMFKVQGNFFHDCFFVLNNLVLDHMFWSYDKALDSVNVEK